MGKEIDFDELDRAVSSLVGRPDSSEPSGAQSLPARMTDDADVSSVPVQPLYAAAAVTTPTTVTTQSVAETPELVSGSQESAEPSAALPSFSPMSPRLAPVSAEAAPVPTPARHMPFTAPPSEPLPQAKEVIPEQRAALKDAPMKAPPRPMPPAIRRTGRFMDVVHPSSDMGARPSPMRPPVAPLAPQPGRIVQPSSKPEVPQPAMVEEEPKWSDSLGFLGRRKKNQDAAEPSPLEVSPQNSESSQVDPLISPFLSDAKVEKRPLGAFNVPDMPATPEVSAAESTMQSFADEQKTPQALPPELGKDLVAIEAGTLDTESRPDTPLGMPPEEAVVRAKQPVSPPQNQASVRQAMATTATLSIPQQYKTKPVDEDNAPHSMFDAEEYRQPVQQTAKKKKGPLFWFTIIFLLLLAGAGVGVGVYFMTGGFN